MALFNDRRCGAASSSRKNECEENDIALDGSNDGSDDVKPQCDYEEDHIAVAGSGDDSINHKGEPADEVPDDGSDDGSDDSSVVCLGVKPYTETTHKKEQYGKGRLGAQIDFILVPTPFVLFSNRPLHVLSGATRQG